jgi:hypothetical protein
MEMGSADCEEVYAGVVLNVVGGERVAGDLDDDAMARSGRAESDAGRDKEDGPATG